MIVNGILAVLGPAIITINILLLTLDIGAKGRINGDKYKTFVILRNRELADSVDSILFYLLIMSIEN